MTGNIEPLNLVLIVMLGRFCCRDRQKRAEWVLAALCLIKIVRFVAAVLFWREGGGRSDRGRLVSSAIRSGGSCDRVVAMGLVSGDADAPNIGFQYRGFRSLVGDRWDVCLAGRSWIETLYDRRMGITLGVFVSVRW